MDEADSILPQYLQIANALKYVDVVEWYSWYIFSDTSLITITSLTAHPCWLMPEATVPSPPVDSIMRLMTVWRITGKIISTSITATCAHL